AGRSAEPGQRLPLDLRAPGHCVGRAERTPARGPAHAWRGRIHRRMGPDQRRGWRLSARPGRGRDRERDPPRLGHHRPGAGGMGQRPLGDQLRAGPHGLPTLVRRAAGALLMAGAALAQVTWAPRFEVGGAFPNLVLLGVVGVTWTLGTRSGLVWACVGGLLLDLTASGPIGPHALALLPGVYLISFWIRNLEHPNALHVAVSAAV